MTDWPSRMLDVDDDGDRCSCGGEFVPGDDSPAWVCARCGKRDFETYPERT